MKRLFILALLFNVMVSASSVMDFVDVEGVRDNQLVGYGLVVGLQGTGDKSAFTQSTLQTYLDNNGIRLPPGVSVKSKNVAAVMVTANMPNSAAVGQTLDVTVSSIGDAKSLRGGTLVMTPLKAVDGNVYALAQGALLVGGVDASGNDGSKITINVTSVGRIPNGANIERSMDLDVVKSGVVTLNVKNPTYSITTSLVKEINDGFGYPVAAYEDLGTIRLILPQYKKSENVVLSRLAQIPFEKPREPARVIVNSRTGTVIITESVRISPVAITHGGVVLQVKETPAAGGLLPQPADTDIAISQASGRMFELRSGAELSELVSAFNALSLAPSDVVAILDALRSAGALSADLEII